MRADDVKVRIVGKFNKIVMGAELAIIYYKSIAG